MSKCLVCNIPANMTCANCHSISYCSKEHQKIHWKIHKSNCKLYVQKENNIYGRYLVASRDIKAGTIIMKESPIIVGPKQDTLPLCLGCHKSLETVSNEDDFYRCTKCSFPLCSQNCENLPMHADNECKIISRCKAPFTIRSLKEHHPAYESIFAIRCLLLGKSDPKKWKLLCNMESQNEIRKSIIGEVWNRNQINVVELLRNHFGMKREFSEDEIHSAIGYADINAFEIKSKTVEICALYDNVYLMVHDCISNTHHSINDDFQMTVRATVPIRKGEIISTIYTQTWEGTLFRRKNLLESKFFHCQCKRCSDPTELGTFFSGIICQNCTTGYLVPIDSLDSNSSWACTLCKANISVAKVHEILQTCKNKINSIKKLNDTGGENMIKEIEGFIKEYSGNILHPNHFMIIDYVHSLSQVYGRIRGFYIEELSLEYLQRKAELCNQLLNLIDIFDPGMSRFRGVTLYELQTTLLFMAKKQHEQKMIGNQEMEIMLNEVIRMLQLAQEILSFDPANSQEGIIAASIPEAIDNVKALMKGLKSTN